MLISVIILLVLLVRANRKISDLEFENKNLKEDVRSLRGIANGMVKGNAEEVKALKEEVKALKEELAETRRLQRHNFYKFREYEALYRTLQNAVMDRFGIRWDEVVTMVNREELKEELEEELKK